MTHIPRSERETSHQTALAGKREGIRHFPSKLLERIRNEAIIIILLFLTRAGMADGRQ